MQKQETEEIIKAAQNFIINIVDFPGKQKGGILVDKVDFWKFKNKLTMVITVMKLIDEDASSIQKLPADVLIPILEESGKKENPKILKMFASLLFGSINSATSFQVHSSYTNVLGQMSLEDIIILEALFHGISTGGHDPQTKAFTAKSAANLFNMRIESVSLSFQNLWRLGLCHKGSDTPGMEVVKQIVFTDYGWNFMRACTLIK